MTNNFKRSILIVTLSSLLGGFSAPLLAAPSVSSISSVTPSLSLNDYQWIGQRIYQNECSAQPKYLTHWGKGEDFPSFGIGHFIWYPPDVSHTFYETFPQMVRFVALQKSPPVWLQQRLQQADFFAPWQSKQQFDQAWSSLELQQLRDWLLATQSAQAHFIVIEFSKRWHLAIANLPLQKQQALNQKLQSLMRFKQGLFAVIDYFNFKGMGNNSQEQYQGQAWGLISVLDAMALQTSPKLSQNDLLQSFMYSAQQRLSLRVRLAPAGRQEGRWLAGWLKRIESYGYSHRQ